MSYAVLVDLTRCIGCRSCQVACKAWNDKQAEETSCLGRYDNPPTLSADTWTVVRFTEVEDNGRFHWVFNKIQCMHCLDPACVSVCTVGALQKTEAGPVTYDQDRCIGCRYCQYGCPFGVPKFEWGERLGLISKCNFCEDRLAVGMEPACVKACPADALVFGERDDLLTEGRARIAARPQKYVNYVYGEKEVGGTSYLYLSPVPFEKLGFPALDMHPLTSVSESIMSSTPFTMVGAVAAIGGFYWLTHQQDEEQDADEEE
jgi:formate dehydrogenase iron-sulfur subunit